MAKKTDKALKDLAKEVKKLRKENEKLGKTLGKVREGQAEAQREILALLEERLSARDTTPNTTVMDAAPEAQETDGQVEETPEAATEQDAAEQEDEPEVTEAANRRAKELGVDPTDVKGTGSGGRVLVKDVEAAAS